MSMSKSVDGVVPHTVVEIGGKKFAGVIVNARPFVELWPRCICGFLAGRDHKRRGFDNKAIRTSTVQSLLLENGKLYAITLNSAYELASVDLAGFLACADVWHSDIATIVALDTPPQEVKVD